LASVAIGITLVHVLTRAETLTDQDSINLANGLERYNVVEYRPHPPGYPLLVAGAHLLGWLGEPLGAYLTLALLGSLGTAAATFLLGRELFGSRAGVVAVALVCASPLFWYYAGIVSVYPPEAFLAPVVALLAYRTGRGNGPSALMLFPTLAVGGGFRPTMLMLMLPACLVGLYAGRAKIGWAVAGMTLGAVIVAAWTVPMAAKSGGLAAYRGASRQLWESTAREHSLLFGSSFDAAASTALITAFAVASLLVPAVLVLLAARVVPAIPRDRLAWAILLAWVMPYLAIFGLVHFGKPGYVLVLLPALTVTAGGLMIRSAAAPRAAAAIAVASALAYVLLPNPDLPGRTSVFFPTADAVAAQDAESRELRRLAPTCLPPECTIVSLESSRRHWFHDAFSLSERYAPGSRVVKWDDLQALDLDTEALWIGSVIPEAVARHARRLGQTETWVTYRSDRAATGRIEAAMGGQGG